MAAGWLLAMTTFFLSSSRVNMVNMFYSFAPISILPKATQARMIIAIQQSSGV